MPIDVLDDRLTIAQEECFVLRVRVPASVRQEIADALVEDGHYTEQVRAALIARGYLPKPEKKT